MMSTDSFRRIAQAFDRGEVSDRLQIIEQLISVIGFEQHKVDWIQLSRKVEKSSASGYKLSTSPLFLREQGARRTCAASAF
jgi:hypothetical protein